MQIQRKQIAKIQWHLHWRSDHAYTCLLEYYTIYNIKRGSSAIKWKCYRTHHRFQSKTLSKWNETYITSGDHADLFLHQHYTKYESKKWSIVIRLQFHRTNHRYQRNKMPESNETYRTDYSWAGSYADCYHRNHWKKGGPQELNNDVSYDLTESSKTRNHNDMGRTCTYQRWSRRTTCASILHKAIWKEKKTFNKYNCHWTDENVQRDRNPKLNEIYR